MAVSEGAPTRCLYEIMGVERSATADEIKAAYRKQALRLHPDKVTQSGVSEEEATARFQELAKAYDVLSDPRERSWYDSHRTQILYSSSSSSSKPKSSDLEINLWPYFSASAYSGHGNTGKGFFKVYSDVFNRLYQSELFYARNIDTSVRVREAPLMGDLGSPYEQVEAFYDYWFGFSTVKGFEWEDAFDVPMSAGRRARRLAEEENKKFRRKAKREYNDTVRQLAEFVKKRDKRVLQRQLEKKKAEEAKATEAKLRREQLKREKMEKAKQYVEPDWAKVDDRDCNESVGEDDWYSNGKAKSDNAAAEEALHELYCVVCSKKFKSDKQWKNHEQSKKHKEKVAELKQTFHEEDEMLEELLEEIDAIHLHESDQNSQHQGFSENSNVASKVEEAPQEREGGASDSDNYHDAVDDEDEDGDSDDESSFLEAMMKSHRTKNLVKKRSLDIDKEHFVDTDADTKVEENNQEREGGASDRSEECGYGYNGESSVLEAKNLVKNSYDVELDVNSIVKTHELDADVKEDSCTSTPGEEGKGIEESNTEESTISKLQPNQDDGEISRETELPEIKDDGVPKLTGKDDRKIQPPPKSNKNVSNKKSVSASLTTKEIGDNNKKKSKKKKGKDKVVSTALKCQVCGEDFDSRNQLFGHLGKTGHAILKSK